MSAGLGNARAIEAWNTVLFDKFSTYEHLLVKGLGQHGSQLFERYPPRPMAHVLDIGCGFGDSTIAAHEPLFQRRAIEKTLPVVDALLVACAQRFGRAGRRAAGQPVCEHGVFRVADGRQAVVGHAV